MRAKNDTVLGLGNPVLFFLLTLFISGLFTAGCDISPVPTPIPGDEGDEDPFLAGSGYSDDELAGGVDPTAPLDGAEEGGEFASEGQATGDEGAGAGDESADNEVGGGEGDESDGTSADCDIVSAPDGEDELDGECDEESELTSDVSPDDEDSLEGESE